MKYRDLEMGAFYQYVGDDAQKWAEAFCEFNPGLVEKDLLITWFANAIETSHDLRLRYIKDQIRNFLL